MPPLIKFLTEFGPLLVFFGAYMLFGYDIIIATKYLVVFSVLSLLISFYYTKSIPKNLLYSTIAVVVLGSITLFTKNSSFIKMKPTAIYILFACIIYFSLLKKKILLKNILGKELNLSDEAWIIFSKRWSYFFIFLAALNEFVWRNYSEVFWVKFKVFGIMILFVVFILSQIPFISKNKQ